MRQYHQAVRIMNKQTQTGGSVTRRSRQMLRRGAVLAAVFGIGMFALLLARLYQLQIVDHARYESMAISQQLRSTPGALERGVIYDRNGNVLALSAAVDNVYLSPAEIAANGEDRRLIARGLAEILDLDESEIYEKSGRTGSWYVTVKRQVEREQADAVRRFKSENGIRGVRLESDSKRYYPNGRLASHLLGFVGVDNTGLEGIEAKYDDDLSGTRGSTRRATNAYGSEMLLRRYEHYSSGEDGNDLVLSIDASIQYYVEKHLRQAAQEYDVQHGAGAIAMDPNTGAILAMASLQDLSLIHI